MMFSLCIPLFVTVLVGNVAAGDAGAYFQYVTIDDNDDTTTMRANAASAAELSVGNCTALDPYDTFHECVAQLDARFGNYLANATVFLNPITETYAIFFTLLNDRSFELTGVFPIPIPDEGVLARNLTLFRDVDQPSSFVVTVISNVTKEQNSTNTVHSCIRLSLLEEATPVAMRADESVNLFCWTINDYNDVERRRAQLAENNEQRKFVVIEYIANMVATQMYRHLERTSFSSWQMFAAFASKP